MRIVYLHQYFNTPSMPGSTRSFEMGRRLVQLGHEVHIVTSWRERTLESGWFESEECGLHVHWLPVSYSNAMAYAERIKAFIQFAFNAARKASRLQADVIFASSTPLTIAIPGVYGARRQGIPLVFEVRDLWPQIPIAMNVLGNPILRWLAKRLELFAYGNSTHIVALSPGMARGVTATGYSEKKVTIIPNAADLDGFRPDPQRGATFRSRHPELGNGDVVLYPGTLGKINGVDYAVNLAVASIEEFPDCRFVIIGSGAEWEHVRSKAQSSGVLHRNFFMYPPIPKAEMAEAFSAASVILSLCVDLPELEANSANKFFDALASGTPVAINYGGWQEDLLTEVGAGLRLSRDPRIATNELQSLLADRSRMKRFSMQSRRLAETRFSCDQLAGQLESVLTNAVVSWKANRRGA